MTDGRDEPTDDREGAPAPDRDDEDPPTRFARVKTGVTEAVGVAVDAVLDAI